MLTIDVLMPAASDGYAPLAAEALAGYRDAFAKQGVTIAPRSWDAGPGDGAATLALFAWGYHLDVMRWEAMLVAWPSDRLLFNPADLLRWNTCKTYLQALEAKSIAIVPSLFCDADAASVAAAFAHFDTDQLVIKPQVSGGSYRTERLRPGMPVTPLPDAIIQPFLPAVVEEGELSQLFIDGEFSHAVCKVATGGDFRIQPQFGGQLSAVNPDAEARALADRVIAALPQIPLYARVDLIRLADGSLALMELEAIEPDLYTDHCPQVRDRLASAVVQRLR